MPKKEEKGRRKLVVEEVETPVDNEMVSSTQLQEEPSSTKVSQGQEKPEILEEAAKTEAAETPSHEMEEEIHEEESHLHDIHTGAAKIEPEILPMSEKKGNPLLWILIPGIFLLGALLGGIFFYQKGINKGQTETPSPSAEATPTPSPSPSPLAKADLGKYPINVKNGSGIAGAASIASDLLTKAGFTVSGTGNAPSYDYANTIIQVKSDVPQAFINQLSTTLKTNYSLGTIGTLKDSSTDEVVVIMGSSKAH